VAGDLPRSWMTDEYFDLFVWYEEDGTIHGFQLCYDKPGTERAITWLRTGRLSHTLVDSGEDKPGANRIPVLGSHAERQSGIKAARNSNVDRVE
jgi:hypothetical protein